MLNPFAGKMNLSIEASCCDLYSVSGLLMRSTDQTRMTLHRMISRIAEPSALCVVCWKVLDIEAFEA